MLPQNCTYFQSSATALVSGQCTLKICKCSTDICQVSHQALQGPVFLLEKLNKILPNFYKKVAKNTQISASTLNLMS
jgi:hypothetical protein